MSQKNHAPLKGVRDFLNMTSRSDDLLLTKVECCERQKKWVQVKRQRLIGIVLTDQGLVT